MMSRTPSGPRTETRRKLLDAGVKLMRARGFNATTVEDICSDAGVTKGGFFHYFKSKDDVAKAALAHFYAEKAQAYEAAPFRALADPLERIWGRLDYLKASTGGKTRVTKGCLIGVFAQELAFSNPAIREACQEFFSQIAGDFARDLAAAKAAYAPGADFAPEAVAQLYLSVLQGSLLLAKAAGSNAVLGENIEQFRSYLQRLLGPAAARPAAERSDKSRR